MTHSREFCISGFIKTVDCHIKESYNHMLRSACSILKVLLFILIAITCFAQSSTTPSAPPASATTASSAAGEDDDSADIPAFARGTISEQQYLDARDREIRIGCWQLMTQQPFSTSSWQTKTPASLYRGRS